MVSLSLSLLAGDWGCNNCMELHRPATFSISRSSRLATPPRGQSESWMVCRGNIQLCKPTKYIIATFYQWTLSTQVNTVVLTGMEFIKVLYFAMAEFHWLAIRTASSFPLVDLDLVPTEMLEFIWQNTPWVESTLYRGDIIKISNISIFKYLPS